VKPSSGEGDLRRKLDHQWLSDRIKSAYISAAQSSAEQCRAVQSTTEQYISRQSTADQCFAAKRRDVIQSIVQCDIVSQSSAGLRRQAQTS